MSRLRLASRSGMTIIEVLFAVVILSGVMLALARYGQAFARATRNAANLTLASDLASSRIEVVRSHRTYATLTSTYNGVQETSATSANPSMAGYEGYTRSTAVQRTIADTLDYTTVTVTVTAATSALLTKPVVKTVVIARF